jgi:8-oxo-dGTP pyrophosphatase MutT (NUDIX family)
MGNDPTTGPARPRRLVPKDAATLVLVDRAAPEPRILLGRRRADLAFLAGKFVFPGGRVDTADKSHPSSDELHAVTAGQLLTGMRGRKSIARARALAIAAIRETREETGLALGDPAKPRLSALSFLARAITPPGASRRYDTRFFMADAGRLPEVPLGGDGELLDLAWFTLDQARALDLPGITRLIMDDIATTLAPHAGVVPIPFYFVRH